MSATTERRAQRKRNVFETLRGSFGLILASGRLPAALIALSCAILIYGLLFSGDFAVRTVDVSGMSYGNPSEVALQAGAIDRSVFDVDASQVASDISDLPYVASVDVQLALPNEVSVQIVEREPVVVWRTAQGGVAVDAFGVVMGPPPAAELPTIHADGIVPEPGTSVSQEIITAVHSIAEELPDAARIDWSQGEGLIVTMESGQVIDFGVAQQMPAKLTVLHAVRAQIGDQWETLDLTVPERPAYK